MQIIIENNLNRKSGNISKKFLEEMKFFDSKII
jgi:hypothetical protein